MCSCSKLLVLDVRNPSEEHAEIPGVEVPLIKELTPLKRSKDVQNSSCRTSPLLEGLSSDKQIESADHVQSASGGAERSTPVPEVQAQDKWYVRNTPEHSRRDGSLVPTNIFKTERIPKGAAFKGARSPQSAHYKLNTSTGLKSHAMNDFNMNVRNLDGLDDLEDTLQHVEDSMRNSAEPSQPESLQRYLDRLGTTRDQAQGNPYSIVDMAKGEELAVLHNWRNDGEQSHALQTDKLELDLHAWNLNDSERHIKGVAKKPSGTFFASKQERYTGDITKSPTMNTQYRQIRSQRSNSQIVSPLTLNLNADESKIFGQCGSQPYFSLEENPSYEVREKLVHSVFEREGCPRQERPRTSVNKASKSSSPCRPHRTQASKYSEPSQVQSPSFGFRPETLETEFFEYDVETLDQQPSMRRESKIGHKHFSQEYSYDQEQTLSKHSYSSLKYDGRRPFPNYKNWSGSSGKPTQLKSPYSNNSSKDVVEPLPLVTELEEYNGTDEYCETSVYGDYGTYSMGNHHRELEMTDRDESRGDTHEPGANNNSDQLQLSVRECKDLVLCESQPRSLSQKYRPKVFDELVGQPIVSQALSNALLKGRIAPAYLFQGSRGTGKTTAARIFSSALVCTSSERKRPCGECRECISVAKGMNPEVKEVDAASNNGIERVKMLLEETISMPVSRYRVFIIDECHVLSAETWNALLKILEEPPMNVVFILTTTDVDQLPRTALSRCQRFPFPKIKDSDIVERLKDLVSMESLSIDPEILQIIASRSDGSLRDAETTLDQVTLLGHEVNASTVHELVGCASDDRILSLLDAALMADTMNTVREARELVNSGMEPLSVMSRLAAVIADILAGGFNFTENQRKGFFSRQSFSEETLEQLRGAMKILAEAEKQVRVSNDRTTWLIAALLRLGPDRICTSSFAGTSAMQSPATHDDLGESGYNDFDLRSAESKTLYSHPQSFTDAAKSHEDSYKESENSHIEDRLGISYMGPTNEERFSTANLDIIWSRVVERCQSRPLQQFLFSSVKLTSISITEVDAMVSLEVSKPAEKSSCEQSQKSIALLFQSVLGFPVGIKVSLAPHSVMRAQGSYYGKTQKGDPGNTGRTSSSNQPTIPSDSLHKQYYKAALENESHQSAQHRSSLAESRTEAKTSIGVAPGDINTEEHRIVSVKRGQGTDFFDATDMQENNRLRQSPCTASDSIQSLHNPDVYYVEEDKQGDINVLWPTSGRRQAKPSPYSHPSPDGVGSHIKVSRVFTKPHANQQKHFNVQSSHEASKQMVDFGDDLITQKKNKLKGAAGSLAKLFQGKLSK
ncbi:hypothetical protein KP509_14G036000 [Ceratopteris richardii]|uniref:DNA-directed DNA polymerase n=1 Tax=Ceratopteris richardii TaxID=49495 RepID=A0A8T2TC46_CERRI|nr:hypothetical protein KP509_14G036000 [Ceratopteris richardii]